MKSCSNTVQGPLGFFMVCVIGGTLIKRSGIEHGELSHYVTRQPYDQSATTLKGTIKSVGTAAVEMIVLAHQSTSEGRAGQTLDELSTVSSLNQWQARFQNDPWSPLPSRGDCENIFVEKLHPGGFGASLMRVVYGYRTEWLKGFDYIADTSTWSYSCNSTHGWQCYFRNTQPCRNPHLDSTGRTHERYDCYFASHQCTHR